MTKIYTYSRVKLIAFIPTIIGMLVFILLIKAFWHEVFPIENIAYSLIVIFIISISIMGFVFIFINLLCNRKVIITDESITIKNIFKTSQIQWNNISEVGRYKAISGYTFIIHYYLKTYQNRKIELFINSINNIDELINTLFIKTPEAKFVTIVNTVWLPFTKHLKNLPWNKEDNLIF